MSVGISAAGVASSTSLAIGPANGVCKGVSVVGALNVELDIVGAASSTSLAVGPVNGCWTTGVSCASGGFGGSAATGAFSAIGDDTGVCVGVVEVGSMSVGISATGAASSTSLTVGPAHGFCAGVSAVGALNVGLDIVGTASSTSLAVGPAIGCSTTGVSCASGGFGGSAATGPFSAIGDATGV